ncbi:cytochrome c biogenesis protein CcsA [Solitalea lacus]|uniref:cytochrome c biogenesis protein CcsA n=1 Tax=Solitalea lacus TaxID=2911172 RepID=UPI001EDB9EF2|nr:cytochrome c biogenesis protein CcsA [Solitalea lacus]UKJ09358.1 cytochrome c biogenesis protein [Solitalea lacus]
MMKNWWKLLAVVLIFYSLISGLLIKVPQLAILHESIRNLYFHVPMWFTMIMLFLASVVYSIKYLQSGKEHDDLKAVEFVNTGVLFGVLGLLTGSLWAKFTWGTWWTPDPKLNSALIAILIYFAYLVLRGSLDEEQKRARIGAVYNIFAFPVMIVLIFVLPRMTDSLHPGNGGNPGFNRYDLDSNMRIVFYPACLGWILAGFWIAQLRFRIRTLQNHFLSK